MRTRWMSVLMNPLIVESRLLGSCSLTRVGQMTLVGGQFSPCNPGVGDLPWMTVFGVGLSCSDRAMLR